MNEDKIPCSVLMLTCNSAKYLEPALRSVQRFGEILVYDGNSEDNTVEIAKRFGAEVRKQYDTDEKSVKIKDFTELYLRQREEAKYDWVFYFDSDECLSEGAVEEVAEIIKNSDNKTLIHFLRFPIINGRVCKHGAFFPEKHLRIHNRKGGCTLNENVLVHSKYVYDNSFHHVCVKNPMNTFIPSVLELIKKDDHYLILEIKRNIGRKWREYLYWDVWRKFRSIISVIFHMVWNYLRHGFHDSVPICYELRTIRYHILYMWGMTKYMVGI